eukprot:1819422-Amphidinium_carterae.1
MCIRTSGQTVLPGTIANPLFAVQPAFARGGAIDRPRPGRSQSGCAVLNCTPAAILAVVGSTSEVARIVCDCKGAAVSPSIWLHTLQARGCCAQVFGYRTVDSQKVALGGQDGRWQLPENRWYTYWCGKVWPFHFAVGSVRKRRVVSVVSPDRWLK